MRHAKLNVEQIANEMAKWSISPFYSRKEGKDLCLLNMDVSMSKGLGFSYVTLVINLFCYLHCFHQMKNLTTFDNIMKC